MRAAEGTRLGNGERKDTQGAALQQPASWSLSQLFLELPSFSWLRPHEDPQQLHKSPKKLLPKFQPPVFFASAMPAQDKSCYWWCFSQISVPLHPSGSPQPQPLHCPGVLHLEQSHKPFLVKYKALISVVSLSGLCTVWGSSFPPGCALGFCVPHGCP